MSTERIDFVIDNLFTNLVAAGETGGILDTIMNRLAIFIEKSQKLQRRIKAAFDPLNILNPGKIFP